MRLRILLLISLFIAGLSWLVYNRFHEIQTVANKKQHTKSSQIIPVEVKDISRGKISLRRNFTGTLKAREEFVISPKIDGRVIRLEVDLGDTVSRNMLVASLDDEELLQTLAQEKADLSVTQANLAEAQSLLIIADRELKRIEKLSKSGFNSVSEQDVAKANQLAKQAHVLVSKALVTRAKARLEVANIQLSYTQVRASWQQGNEQRVVAERLVNEGETVSANSPLLRIVEYNPIKAVFYVTENDYAKLKLKQQVQLSTDAYPDERFNGQIYRVSPVFNEQTRQAKVEVSINNPDLRLKPGMYVRVRVVLDSIENATLIPKQALVSRNKQKGVFIVSQDGKSVSWQTVKVGISEAAMIQLMDNKLKGRVVTLGQQFLKDGSLISLPNE